MDGDDNPTSQILRVGRKLRFWRECGTDPIHQSLLFAKFKPCPFFVVALAMVFTQLRRAGAKRVRSRSGHVIMDRYKERAMLWRATPSSHVSEAVSVLCPFHTHVLVSIAHQNGTSGIRVFSPDRLV